jgi:hypothetical protein
MLLFTTIDVSAIYFRFVNAFFFRTFAHFYHIKHMFTVLRIIAT